MSNAKKYRILGIDPGTNFLGFGVLEIDGRTMKLIKYGAFKMKSLENHQEKLNAIFKRVSNLIQSYAPEELAIEAPFFGKNVQSMLKLGRAQGVAIAAAMNQGLSVVEYSPKKVKQSVTGNGNASKEQVAAMVGTLVTIKDNENDFDATDAVAVAICHHFQKTSGLKITGNKSWKAFIKANPDKIRM